MARVKAYSFSHLATIRLGTVYSACFGGSRGWRCSSTLQYPSIDVRASAFRVIHLPARVLASSPELGGMLPGFLQSIEGRHLPVVYNTSHSYVSSIRLDGRKSRYIRVRFRRMGNKIRSTENGPYIIENEETIGVYMWARSSGTSCKRR